MGDGGWAGKKKGCHYNTINVGMTNEHIQLVLLESEGSVKPGTEAQVSALPPTLSVTLVRASLPLWASPSVK